VTQNPFIWHDLMTTDIDAAKTFYGAVVGWTFSAHGSKIVMGPREVPGWHWIVSALDP
jgi:predicted enzyme related to lactoylglutathione lyase